MMLIKDKDSSLQNTFAEFNTVEPAIMPLIEPATFPAIEPATFPAIEPAIMPVDPVTFPIIEPVIMPVEPTILPISDEEQALYDQLNEIFGSPKFDLTKDEQKQVDELNSKIENMLSPNENGERPKLSEAQETELDLLFGQIDDIFGIVYYEDLSEEQQKEVDDIYAQLDELFAINIDPISKAEQALYDQLDDIFGTPSFELTEDEQKQVDELNRNIEDILSPDENGEWPVLSAEQESELELLFDQIDDVFGIVHYDDLSEEQQSEVDGIYAQLDDLWAIHTNPISETEQALFDELDDIFGTPDFDLTEGEQNQVDELNGRIDEILSPNENGEWPELTDAQETELDQLFSQIDEIYGIVTYDNLNEDQQDRVDSIYAELDELRNDPIDIMPVEPILVDIDNFGLEPIDILEFTDNGEGEWFISEEYTDTSVSQELPDVQTLELPGIAVCGFGFDMTGF